MLNLLITARIEQTLESCERERKSGFDRFDRYDSCTETPCCAVRSTTEFWTKSSMMFDYMLGLKIDDFLERCLQTQMFKLGPDKYSHLARFLVRQRSVYASRSSSSVRISRSTSTSRSSCPSAMAVRDAKNMKKGQNGGGAADEEKD
ncbi:40S ribosomal protein S9 [Culex quinquefasciatus]|uniref:40S ribosomal protein S9 n=1 Tax=Culex quinquefasciatus TaxID=7176 RepID=B0W3L9_CULQU|nr:40S ribosomal protein S9 [Culex quinquefasciatus]|eukprot:XP_001843303.1 40S ribosomal protein S9 [Culex quinquefasciatus]